MFCCNAYPVVKAGHETFTNALDRAMDSSGEPENCTAAMMPQNPSFNGEAAAAQFAGVRLANRAGGGIHAARAATAVNSVPVDGVSLR